MLLLLPALESHVESTPSAVKVLEEIWRAAHIAKQNEDWPTAIQQCFRLLLEMKGMVQGENEGAFLSAAFIQQANHSINLLIEFIGIQESGNAGSSRLSPRPISFSIPINKWERHANLRSSNRKLRHFSLLTPGDHSTYIYADENQYITQYAESYFALTWKKAGFDALRHYEILAAGAIPFFMDVSSMNKACSFSTAESLAPIALFFGQCDLHPLSSWHENIHCS